MPPLKHSLTDPDWRPQAGDFTWTRIDKSTTRALGMIIREPADLAAKVLNKEATPQNVYCDQDAPDRYSIACLTRHGDQDSHVYVPRHYMKAFDLANALSLKCMKTRPRDVRDLTPWDRDKRHSIKVVQKWLDDKKQNSLDSVHHFVECPECCDEASDEFWKAVKLERGDAHVKRRESLEKRRQMIKKECQERDQLLRDRQLKAAAAKGSSASDGEREGSAAEGADEESSTDESGGGDDDDDDDDDDDSSDEAAADDEDDDDASDRESSFEEDAISEDDDDDENASSISGPQRAATTKKGSTGAKQQSRASPSTKKRRMNSKKYFLASPSSSEGTEAEDGGGGGGGGGGSSSTPPEPTTNAPSKKTTTTKEPTPV